MIHLLAPLAVITAAPAVEQAISPAAELAASYMADDAVIADAEANYRAQMTDQFARNPRSERMEARYHGLNAALIDAGAAALRAHYRERLPAFRLQVAEAADRHFGAGELTAVNAFLRSDAGRASLAALRDTMDVAGLKRRMQQTPGLPPALSAAELTAALKPGATLDALSAEHQAVLTAFVQSQAGRRFTSFSSIVTPLIVSQTNAMIADSFPKIQSAMARAERAHVAAARK